MFLTEVDFQRARDNIKKEPWMTFYRRVAKVSEKLLLEQPPRCDTREHNWILIQARMASRAIITLAGFYKLTGEVKYAFKAISFVEDVLSWNVWYWKRTVSGKIEEYDLTTGELAFTFGVVLDWLGGQFGEERRREIVENLEERIVKPYATAINTMDGWSRAHWYEGTNNWNCVCNGGMLCLALYLEKESSLAASVIPLAVAGLDNYIRHMHSDGSSEEGIGYWNYAMMYLTFALLSYERATGSQHYAFSLSALQKGLMFPFEFSPDGVGMSFGDVNQFSPEGFLYALAGRTGQKDVVDEISCRLLQDKVFSDDSPVLSNRNSWPNEILALLCCRQEYTEENKGNYPSEALKVYPDNGWAMFKSAGMYISFRSGSSAVPHGMRDLNSIQVVKDGTLFIQNISTKYMAGWFGENRHMFFEDSTNSKNSILFNGIGQYRYGEADWGHDEKAVWSDAASVYPDFVAKAYRKCSMNRHRFVIEDQLETKQEVWHEIRFLSYTDFLRIEGEKWKLINDDKVLYLEFKSDNQLSFVVCDAPVSLVTGQIPKVLRVITAEPVKESQIFTHIY